MIYNICIKDLVSLLEHVWIEYMITKDIELIQAGK